MSSNLKFLLSTDISILDFITLRESLNQDAISAARGELGVAEGISYFCAGRLRLEQAVNITSVALRSVHLRFAEKVTGRSRIAQTWGLVRYLSHERAMALEVDPNAFPPLRASDSDPTTMLGEEELPIFSVPQWLPHWHWNDVRSADVDAFLDHLLFVRPPGVRGVLSDERLNIFLMALKTDRRRITPEAQEYSEFEALFNVTLLCLSTSQRMALFRKLCDYASFHLLE